MNCTLCSCRVLDAEHIAIDENGDPVVLCNECYDKVRIFFEEVKSNGKNESRRGNEGGK